MREIGFEITFYVSRKVPEKSKFLKEFFSFQHFLGLWARNLRTFSQNISAGLSRLYYRYPGAKFEGIFCWKKIFPVFPKLWAKLFQNSDESFSAELSKLLSSCPKAMSCGNIFFEFFPKLVLDVERKVFGFLAIFFSRFVTITFYVSRLTFREKLFFRSNFSRNELEISARIYQISGQNFSAWLSKLHSRYPEKSFEGKYVLENLVFQ